MDQNMEWQFCSLPMIKDRKWIYVPELKSNLSSILESDPDANSEYLLSWFVKQGLNNNEDKFASKHLTAFLTKIVREQAGKVHYKLEDMPQYVKLGYEIYDVFGIGLEIACKPLDFFSNYNPEYGNVRNYACRRMYGKIREEIFKKITEGKDALKSSSWWLLKNKSGTTGKELKEALKSAGYVDTKLERYMLAFKCFDNIYTKTKKGGKKYQKPTEEELEQMAKLYNTLRWRQEKLANDSLTVDGQKILNWIEYCAEKLRNYLTPQPYISLDKPIDRQNSDPLLIQITSDEYNHDGDATDVNYYKATRQELIQKQSHILANFCNQLDKENDKVMIMLYGFDMSARAAQPFFKGLSHDTISRRLNKMKQSIIKKLTQEISKDSPDSETIQQRI